MYAAWRGRPPTLDAMIKYRALTITPQVPATPR
jgi:hypothetical protein